MSSISIQQVDDYRWRVPKSGGMRTDGLIFADRGLMHDLEGDQCVQQVVNVAHLPGIVGPSIAMPDIHWGYGFPIGGVAAFDETEGVVSPGGRGIRHQLRRATSTYPSLRRGSSSEAHPPDGHAL